MPELVAQLRTELPREGQGALVPQIEAAVIERYTYDPFVLAGYIYLVRARPSQHQETVQTDIGVNVDVDQDGQVVGIEFLNRSDVIDGLRRAGAL
jgi:uncharacterized protein YuzE